MWRSLFLGLTGFALAQEDELYEDEAVVTDSEIPDSKYKMPTQEELLKVLDSMGLSDEEKNNLRESLMKNGADGGVGDQAERLITASDFTSQTLILLALLSLISLIFENTMAEMILEKLHNDKVLSENAHDKLSNIINRYGDLKDEEKSRFRENAKEIFNKFLNNLLTHSAGRNKWLTWLTDSRVIFVISILIVILIFVFFGYKLYKSLSERERKREEKRKMKQMKKKK